jgi:hypothetical protein
VFAVQSPVADTISSGRGAIVAAISTLLVSSLSVLAEASPLHVQGDHVDRHRDLDAVVDRGEQERLRAAAGLTSDRQRLLLDAGQRLQEIEAPDRIPQLQAGEAHAPQRFALASEGVRELTAVVVADHVVGEDDESLAGEIDGAARDRVERRVLQPPVSPMPMRRQHRGEGACADWPIEVPGHQEPGQALKVDLLDGVVVLGDLAEDLRRERRTLRHRQEPGGSQDVLAQVSRALLPFDGIRESRWRELIVEGPEGRLTGDGGGRQDE